MFFLQFVLIGAGKPAEYGRFGIFTNTALAIAAACLLVRPWTRLRAVVNWIPASMVVIWVGVMGWYYVSNFQIDAGRWNTRSIAADALKRDLHFSFTNQNIVAAAEPAPYCCPPLDFRRWRVILDARSDRRGHDLPAAANEPFAVATFDDSPQARVASASADSATVVRSGRGPWELESPSVESFLRRTSPISWANKPLSVHGPHRLGAGLVDPRPETVLFVP